MCPFNSSVFPFLVFMICLVIAVAVLLRPDFPPLMHQRKIVSLSSKTHGMSQEIKGTKRESGKEQCFFFHHVSYVLYNSVVINIARDFG